MSLTSWNKCTMIVTIAATALAVGLSTKSVTAATVDVKQRPMEWIPPGTFVERNAPNGWSHLVYVAYPRVGSGDVDQVSKLVLDYGRLFTVATVANVVPERSGVQVQYRLDRVAVGIGTSINGRNTIINLDTERKLGARLSFIARQIFSQSEQNFRTGNIQVARTPTMFVFDHDVMLLVRAEHRKMICRNVLLVSRDTGEMGMLRWLFNLNSDGSYSLVDGSLQFLSPGFQEDQVLNVKADEFFLGLPGERAFAQVRMAPGTQLEFTDSLQSLAARRRYTASSALELERELWKLWGMPAEGK